MRIAIYGSGGVGGYFGARLARAGHDVTFLARGAHLRAMQERGLRVTSPLGDLHLPRVAATSDPPEVGVVELVIVATKAWQVEEAARRMGPLVGEGTVILPLQNGVEAPERLAGVLGRERVLGGFCQILSFIAEPGHIRHAGITPYVALGELDGGPGERPARLAAALRVEGITVEVPDDIRRAMWAKFLMIASWSGVGALARAPVGVLREHPGTRRLLRDAMEEIVAVGRAHGVAWAPDAVDGALAFIDRSPPGGTASLQRDVMEGRPSELDAQTGAVVRLGTAVGVLTPINRVILDALTPLERRARGELTF